MKMQSLSTTKGGYLHRPVKCINLNSDISVIIPIYNVEQYIAECLDTVLNQTYKRIEIILIDDGSTDSSGKIADNYALKDERVRVVHKKNGGLSDARNAGVKIARGDYVMFIDSDDYVDRKFAATALQSIKEFDADIVCFRFTYVDDAEEIKISSTNTNLEHKIYTNIDAIKDIFTIGGALKVNAWNKIYKRSLFTDNGIMYPVGRLYEDNLTTYRLMYFSKKIVYLNKPLLFYRQRPGSIMKNKLTIQGVRERVAMLNETVGWLASRVVERDLRAVRKIYVRTLGIVLVGEALAKRQYHIIPTILFAIVNYKIRGLR